jgi:hypothetical protein
MGNTLKVALVQEVSSRSAQHNAFKTFNSELRTDARRVAQVLGNLLVGRPVETEDGHIASAVDAVLVETKTGAQIGFGTEAEAQKTTPTQGGGEWAWGEVFADERHRMARHDYVRLATELRAAEQGQPATGDRDSAPEDRVTALAEAAQTAKRQCALATLCVMAELNTAVVAEPTVSAAAIEVAEPVRLIERLEEQRVLSAA